jgi:hypothetical protein
MSCLRDVQEYFFPQWAQNLVSRPFFLLSTTKNLADASVRGFTGLVNTAVCVWYVGGYVTQLRPAHNQIHQMLALGGPAKWDKWMRALVSSSVRIPELGLGNFSPDAVVCIGGDRRLSPRQSGCA